MGHEVLRAITAQILEWDRPSATFEWHGGEPLLATLPFYRNAIELQREFNEGKDRRIANLIQTNGTLVNDEWAEFFAQNRFSVGVSIDGPEEIHDRQRVDVAGNGTYRKVMRGVERLRRVGIKPGVVCVVHRDNFTEPEAVYRGLLDAGFRSFHFKPMYDHSHGVMSADSVSGEEYTSFLLGVFRLWAEADDSSIEIGNFIAILAGLLGGRPHLCEHAGQCTSLITIDWNGQIGACDAFPKGSFDLGNVLSAGLAAHRTTVGFDRLKAGMTKAQEGCQGCEFFKVCAGGCFKYSYDPMSEVWGHNAFCSSKKTLFRELLEYSKTGKIRMDSAEPMPSIPAPHDLEFKHGRLGLPIVG